MNKQGWLIYKKEDAERNKAFITLVIEEAQKQGLDLELKLRETLHIGVQEHQLTSWENGQRVLLPDLAIVRTIDPLLSEQLELLGVHCFNSSKVSRLCNDKAKTHQILASKGAPMVDTLFVKADELSSLPFDYPFIVKDVQGRGGKNVHWVEDEKDLHNLPLSSHEDLIIQKPAPQLGKDLRVFIVGNEIVGAILRENQKDFKANFSLGGSAALYDLSEKERQLIHQIIEPFNFDMVGIDFLFDKENNLLLNEIEDVVGSRTLFEKSSVNIAELYISHIIKTV